MKNRVMIYAAAAAMAAFAAQAPVAAQSSAAKAVLHGIVTDPSGAAIPAATVVVTGAHLVRTLSTDGTGQYVITGLPPGHYSVQIQSAGFSPAGKSGLVLSAGYETEADAQLTIRASKQEITVTAGDLD
jgi:hypothetical protein